MKQLISITLYTAVALAFSAWCIGNENEGSWLIIPGVNVGPITPKSSEADLIKIYGKQNVVDESLCLDVECSESEIGTVVYPKDPLKIIKIHWKDVAAKKYPKSAHLSGSKSNWKLADGISLGTSLKELVKINGKAFTFYGFGWDLNGCIKSWEKGNIESKYSDLIGICLSEGRSLSAEEQKEVIGNRVLNSSSETVGLVKSFV
jgi:hypothetical protein